MIKHSRKKLDKLLNDKQIVALLKSLCCVGGTPGDETVAAEVAAKELGKYMDVSIDALGNVIGRKKGEGTRFLLDAHIDRVGMVVTAITDEGFLKVGACGGIDLRVLDAAEVTVFGKKKIYGVVSAIPPHLSKNDENKASDITDITIDIGMDKETAEKYITPSDRVVVNSEFVELLSSRVCCGALDDRAGVASLILACDMLEEKGISPDLSVVFSVCEETGGSGAKTSSYAIQADEAIAVDVSFAVSPGVSSEEAGVLSDGPMIGFSSTLDYKMSNDFVNVAEKNNIKYQKEIMGSRTGTNADCIAVSGFGVKMGLISIPLRNMHTSAEIVDIEDIKNTAKLISEYIMFRMEEC